MSLKQNPAHFNLVFQLC